jgi:regulatory protein
MFKPQVKTKEPDNFKRAYDYAIFLLNIRLRTEGELMEKLLSKGYNEEAAKNVLQSLKESHFVNDQNFAEIFLDNLKKYKNFGFYGIKKKFMEKRLPPEIIARVLEEGLPVEEEIKIAERFLKKQFPSGVILTLSASEGEESLKQENRSFSDAQDDGRIRKQKIARQLQARGFRSEVIAKFLI